MSVLSAPVRPEAVEAALESLRRDAPLVQCLTNTVVSNWTANVLLAAGAAPAMVDNPHEAGEFAGVADAVLVNLGTPYDDTVAGMRAAVTGAREAGTPWVLDPVAVGPLAWRTGLAHELLEGRPRVIRGNASEIAALAGGAGGRGTDATEGPEAVLEQARELARRTGAVVAMSGPVDHLLDADRLVRVAAGHPWLTRVTGVGCGLGALVAACAGVEEDALVAATAATALLTVAGEDAAAGTSGPGTFAPALLDALATLDPSDVVARAGLR